MKSFLRWMENEESPALSEPQHKRGESNMGLDALVERRMKQIIMDLEGSGKGTQQEILASVGKYLSSKGVPQNQQTDQSQPKEQPQQADQAQQVANQAQNAGVQTSVI